MAVMQVSGSWESLLRAWNPEPLPGDNFLLYHLPDLGDLGCDLTFWASVSLSVKWEQRSVLKDCRNKLNESINRKCTD